MKKQCILLLTVFLAAYVISCNWDVAGHNAVSNDIEESKKRQIFVSTYHAPESVFYMNDTLKLNIRNAWLEKCWKYGKRESETILIDGYQLILEVDEDNLKGYTINWNIGIDGNSYFRPCSNNSLISDIKDISPDSLFWIVQKGGSLSDNDPHDSIGYFMLIKSR